MHIEVWQSSKIRDAANRGSWFWRFKSRNGRVVADAEAFATKAGAIRAAKSVVRQVVNLFPGKETWFAAEERGRKTIIRWS